MVSLSKSAGRGAVSGNTVHRTGTPAASLEAARSRSDRLAALSCAAQRLCALFDVLCDADAGDALQSRKSWLVDLAVEQADTLAEQVAALPGDPACQALAHQARQVGALAQAARDCIDAGDDSPEHATHQALLTEVGAGQAAALAAGVDGACSVARAALVGVEATQ